MPTVTVRVVKLLNLKVPTSTLRDMRDIGTQAVAIMRDRIAAGRNVNDSPAKPYRARGPVYAAIYGRGTIMRDGVATPRNRDTLKSQFLLGRADLRKMGVKVARGRKTVRFENYAAMKKAMGGSGRRDLTPAGKMLGSVMASLVTKKKGQQLYYYVVECARVDGQPRIVHQAYLGNAENNGRL